MKPTPKHSETMLKIKELLNEYTRGEAFLMLTLLKSFYQTEMTIHYCQDDGEP